MNVAQGMLNDYLKSPSCSVQTSPGGHQHACGDYVHLDLMWMMDTCMFDGVVNE